MLKGDLSTTPLAPLLLDLADNAATGCLNIIDTDDEEALVYFKSGLIYSVLVPGNRPQLGAKLVSSGALAPEALAEALDAQRNELQGWRLGELLVHLGYVEQPVVEAFVKEQVSEAVWDLLRWSDGRWKFRKNVKAREDVGPPMVVVELLESLRERGYEWESISAIVHGPTAVPRLSARDGAAPETTLDNDAWSMLCKIDGERSVADLANDCGYTLFEAGHIIVSLVQAGLVDIDEDVDIEGDALYGATTLMSALAGDLESDADEAPADAHDDEDAMARLARLVSEVAKGTQPDGPPDEDGTPQGASEAEPALDGPPGEAGQPGEADQAVAMDGSAPIAPAQRRPEADFDSAMIVPLFRRSNESFAAAIARVSGALSEVLGEAPVEDDTHPVGRAVRPRNAPSTDDPEWQRRRRLRSAAAAELATAQALIETLRTDLDVTSDFDGEIPKVASRESERRRAAARDAEQAARLTEEETARAAAEEFARAAAEEAQRHAAEVEAARVAAEEAAEAERAAAEAAEAELERLRAERAAAEEVGWAEYWRREEAERLEAERLAAEEAERVEAERLAAEEAARAEAERLEAERLTAEEAARAEAERVEAERLAAEEAARAEAERIEAERLEAERLAAEEAERVEAERLEAERLEAERLAAEEAERLEAERLAAEEAERLEAERLAAEEAERLEAERLEAERVEAERVEAQRVEAERVEAERLAAEEEARVEAERVAAEEAEAARIEAERVAAEEAEAARIAAEKAEEAAAERAAEEAERLAAEAEAARVEAEEAEVRAAEQKTKEAAAARAERVARRKAEKLAAEEAARREEAAAAATALLVELSSIEHPEPSADAEPPKSAATPDEDAPDEAAMEPVAVGVGHGADGGDGTDTAALLRELSSLGGDDEPEAPAPPVIRPPRRNAPPEKKPKKKIGLFGL